MDLRDAQPDLLKPGTLSTARVSVVRIWCPARVLIKRGVASPQRVEALAIATARHSQRATERAVALYARLVVLSKAGRFGKWRRPIQASAARWLATVSADGRFLLSVHH